mgnify:FL=1
MKVVKKVLIVCLILIIQSLIFIYNIITKFWDKYNVSIKKFVKKLDKELRTELQ